MCRTILSALALLSLVFDTRAQTPDVKGQVVPFLAKHCTACHGPTKKKADLTLHQYQDEASILKDRKRWTLVLQMIQGGEMPPEGKPRPTPAEIETLVKTVESAFAKHDAAAGPDPGRVTMRRLNRNEYNNTIRDLLGVDFLAAEDFPSDDVGFGFDNIGDVLSISPLHMERYLAAAENIMAKAILSGTPPVPPDRLGRAIYLQPGSNMPQKQKGNFRPLTKGSLHYSFQSFMGGEFKVVIRGYPIQAGDEPVKIAILLNKNELVKLDLVEKDAKSKNYEATVHLKPGDMRPEVQLLNEFADPKDPTKVRTMMVESIRLVGPMDTRPESHRKLLAADETLDQAAKIRVILKRFADRAYRRPATQAEVDRLLQFVDLAQKRGDKWEAGVALAMQAVLASPKFLFRVELDHRPNEKGPHAIDDFQLASRLSYFLWNSMPDDELFELAGKKQLHKNIDAQVARMLQDPKSKSFVDGFFIQWLQLQPLKTQLPDAAVFPSFNDKLRLDMLKETNLFFANLVKEDRSILEILDCNYSFVNERLAKHYGIVDTNGNTGPKPKPVKGKPAPDYKQGAPIRGETFVKATFQDQRGGIFTQASVLTVTSNPTRTSPVKRGRWVLDQILGTPPPPPPPNVPELDEKKMATGSLRQRMEAHRANVACASCHARMDPIGFAFENYDGIGKFRTTDGEFPIDASGSLPVGQSFQGPKELKQILMGKKELFARTLAEKMLTYATGRGIDFYDRPAVDRIIASLQKQDFKFSTLVTEIAQSDPFRMRRGKDKKD